MRLIQPTRLWLVASCVVSILAGLVYLGTPGTEAGAAQAKAPYPFMVITDVTTPTGSNAAQELDSYRAAVTAINRHGGVNGHQLKMLVCDTQSDPNTTMQCANQAVGDKVPAVLAGTGSTSAFDAVLAKAGIPDIGAGLSSPTQFVSPNVFPVWAGGIGSISGIGTYAGYLQCKKLVTIVSFPTAEVSEIPTLFGVISGVAKKLGVTVGNLIQAPSGLPDYTSYIEDAESQGATCIGIAATGADEVGLIKAARQSGTSAKLITVTDFLPQKSVKSLGSLLNGVNAVSLAYPASAATSHPLVAKWVSDINRYSASPSYTDIDANQWAAVNLFAYAASKVSTVNAISITSFLNTLNNYNPGVTPVVSYGKPAPAGGLGPRMFSPYVLFVRYANGKLVTADKQFVNFSTGQPAP